PKTDSFKFQEHTGELTQATTRSCYSEEAHYTWYYPGSYQNETDSENKRTDPSECRWQ
ncbi:hypothetical protein M405DRAFT_824020, partial [Rhizopogon salebrosus TDB-379]